MFYRVKDFWQLTGWTARITSNIQWCHLSSHRASLGTCLFMSTNTSTCTSRNIPVESRSDGLISPKTWTLARSKRPNPVWSASGLSTTVRSNDPMLWNIQCITALVHFLYSMESLMSCRFYRSGAEAWCTSSLHSGLFVNIPNRLSHNLYIAMHRCDPLKQLGCDVPAQDFSKNRPSTETRRHKTILHPQWSIQIILSDNCRRSGHYLSGPILYFLLGHELYWI